MVSQNEHELPMLAGIAAALAWLESLAVIVSGPLLTFGLAVALVDLLTDGALLASSPALLYAWAVSQAVGVDAQLVGAAYRVRQSLRAGHRWAAAGYGVLVLALGYVAIVAAQVFATQASQGISTAQALSQLGMDSTTWIWQRAVLAVVLVVLSGFLRYTPPAKAKQSAEDERATLERELELEPLRQQLRKTRAGGIAALARQTIAAAVGKPEPDDVPADADHTPYYRAANSTKWERIAEAEEDGPTRPPTGGGTPIAATVNEGDTNGVRTPARASRPQVLRLADSTPRPRRKAAARVGMRTPPMRTPRKPDAAEIAARSVFQPGMSVSDLETAANISRNAASRWRAVILAETGEQVESERAQ